MSIGERIKQIRGRLPQKEFAETIGIAQNTLGGYERGERIPNADVVITVAKAFGVSFDWLLTGEGPTNKDATTATTSSADQNDHQLGASELQKENKELRQELRKERDANRELVAENRQLWKENGELKAEVATLRAEAQVRTHPTEANRRSA